MTRAQRLRWLAIGFLWLKCGDLSGRIRYLGPEEFERLAPVVAVRGPVRLGYVRQFHGCALTWTIDTTGALSADPRRAPSAPGWNREIRRRLIRELKTLLCLWGVEALLAVALVMWPRPSGQARAVDDVGAALGE